MIEDIKKEIEELYIKKYGRNTMKITEVLEILDKYKNQEDKYKKAWEELYKDNTQLIEYNNRAVKDCILYKNRKMYLVNKKYGIEVK